MNLKNGQVGGGRQLVAALSRSSGPRGGGARFDPDWASDVPPLAFPIPGGTADLAGGEVRYQDGQRHDLSGREAELLRYLAQHAGRTVTRDEILQQVWGLNPDRTITRTIDMHVAKLRHKLRDRPGGARVLRTVHGLGYALAITAVGAVG